MIIRKGYYAPIPNELFEATNVDHIAKLIWCYLFSKPENWNSSRNNLARNLGMTNNTVSAHIKQLESFNMVKVVNGERGAWDFVMLSPDEWNFNAPDLINLDTSTESISTPLPSQNERHTKEDVIIKKILKPKNVVKDEEPIPEELNDYYLILKSVSLHLKFKEHLSKIKEVWPEYELFKQFLSQRKEFYEKNNVINENFHKFRATLSKALKEEIGV